MTSYSALLSAAIALSSLSLIAYCVGLYLLWRQRTHFADLRAYLDRIMKYGDGLANIQATLKDMAIEHHSAMESMIHTAKDEIITQIGYTLRYGEALSKLILVGDLFSEKTGSKETQLKQAEQMHEIGITLAEVAFDEKAALEKEAASTLKEELAAAKDELATIDPEVEKAVEVSQHQMTGLDLERPNDKPKT